MIFKKLLFNATIAQVISNFGGLWTWGNNWGGQLGDNTIVNKSSPVQTITGGTDWKQVDTGWVTGAIKTDGTLWLWGYNISGQLGNDTTVSKSSPVQTIAGGTNWKQVSCGYSTAAIKTDGTLWTWGGNANGSIGDNTVIKKSSPVQTTAGGTNWAQVSSRGNNCFAVKTDGTLWVWGNNQDGQLGDGTSVHKSSPVQTIAGGTNWKQVSAPAKTNSPSAAIKTDGTLWTWGGNGYGGLGDNTTTHRSSPVQTVAGGTDWKQVATGYYHTAAIKTDGTLWTWGGNYSGQLGDNTTTHRSSPVQTVAGGTNWKQVSAGGYYTVAIKTDGTLWVWGGNGYNGGGALGDGTTVDKSSPVQIMSGGSGWKYCSAGYSNTAAIE